MLELKLKYTHFFMFSTPLNVALEGNLIVTEETFNNLFCFYNDSFPVGNSSIYCISDVGTEISKILDDLQLAAVRKKNCVSKT